MNTLVEPPKVLGHFELQEAIGRGAVGFATVKLLTWFTLVGADRNAVATTKPTKCDRRIIPSLEGRLQEKS